MTDFSWPDDISPSAVSYYLQPRTGGTESPFNRQTKVYGLSKPRWVCSLRFRALDSADVWGGPKSDWGERLDAFLAEIDGRLNRVELWDFRRPGRAPTFSNVHAFAGTDSMTLTGASKDDIRPGEYIGGDGRPHIITKTIVSGSNLIVKVRPYFEADINAGDAIYEKVTGFFRLTSDDAAENMSPVGEATDYVLDFVEAFGPSVDVTFGDEIVTYSP